MLVDIRTALFALINQDLQFQVDSVDKLPAVPRSYGCGWPDLSRARDNGKAPGVVISNGFEVIGSGQKPALVNAEEFDVHDFIAIDDLAAGALDDKGLAASKAAR